MAVKVDELFPIEDGWDRVYRYRVSTRLMAPTSDYQIGCHGCGDVWHLSDVLSREIGEDVAQPSAKLRRWPTGWYLCDAGCNANTDRGAKGARAGI